MQAEPYPLQPLPEGGMAQITRLENMLLLVPTPGEESWHCGALVAECCARGRPPFVMILGDGSMAEEDPDQADALAQRQERAAREAVAHLGLPEGRLLMAGLIERDFIRPSRPTASVARAVRLVMWARDCNLICAPWPRESGSLARWTHEIAQLVAAESGMPHISYAAMSQSGLPDGAASGWRFNPASHAARRAAALRAYYGAGAMEAPPYEFYLNPLRDFVAEGSSPNRAA